MAEGELVAACWGSHLRLGQWREEVVRFARSLPGLSPSAPALLHTIQQRGSTACMAGRRTWYGDDAEPAQHGDARGQGARLKL